LSWLPATLVNSTARFRGGNYSIVGLVSKKLTGAYLIIYILSNVSLSMYCLSFADYAMPFMPVIPRKILALGILSFMYILNYLGIDKFAKFQNVIVVCLVVALAAFSAYGFGQVNFATYMDNTFMTGGKLGLARAACQLTFATGGAQMIINLSGEAKDPSKDIPKVIFISTIGVAFLYGVMAIIAAGVLPTSEVANQSLVKVANAILPKPLYVFFIIGGAWMALISTLNSQLAAITKPFMQGANDGWLPNWVATLHKTRRTPIVLLTFFLIVGALPIIFNLQISVLSRLVTTVGSVINCMIASSLLFVDKKIPKELWEKSSFHVSDGMRKFMVILAILIFVMQGILLGSSLPKGILIGNIVTVVVALIFAYVRWGSGAVHIEESWEAK
jgi:APA family basic amino acid/polyamine antiporter